MSIIYAPTPSGLKPYGEIRGKEFHRKVDFYRDRMKSPDSWSIYSHVLSKLSMSYVHTLVYTSDIGIIYRIKLQDIKKKGSEKEFVGIRMWYIPFKFWDVENVTQGKQGKLF